MEQLINITNKDGKDIVSARELYEKLGYNVTAWSRWYLKNIEQNPFAIVNEDWVGFDTVSSGNITKDFALTVDFSKRLCMMARTEMGEKLRNYFIACEKRLLTPANDDEIILRAVTTLQTRVEDYKMKLLQANETIIEQAPIVQYANEVLSSPDLISTTIIAKDLGMSASNLNKMLKKMGVLYKRAETWVLYSKYQDRDYTHTKTHTHYDSTGAKRTSIHTYWTEKGRQFIHELLNNRIKTA